MNVNGIFPGRFDLILTNPPFGAKVEADEKILANDIALPEETERHYAQIYGEPYRAARAELKAAVGESIASLFELPRGAKAKIKTEILFVERCLDLLKSGGRMGVVLPEGIFNNLSLAHVREFVEDRAWLRAVVSLPQETFMSSGASVKCSLLFLQKFNDDEQSNYDRLYADARIEVKERHREEIEEFETACTARIDAAKTLRDASARKEAERQLHAFRNQMAEKLAVESRALLKQRFDYPVFLYEADKVGMTATGDADANELYPNDRVPVGIERTALETYREFRRDPTPFFV